MSLWRRLTGRRRVSRAVTPAGFTVLELAALQSICSQYPEERATLQAQLATATVEKRENSGAGFFTTLRVDPNTRRIGARSPIGNVIAKVGGFRHPLGLMLFLESGHAHMLEGYSLGGDNTLATDWNSVEFEIVRPEDVLSDSSP